jgi:hypothetical protein
VLYASLRAPRRWAPAAGPIALRPSAGTLADVRPLLARVVDALGTNAAARLLDVDRALVSRWHSGAALKEVHPLRLQDAVLIEASRVIARPIVETPRR